MKIERIEDIKKKFNDEWLLIEVTEFDRTTSTSVKGQLIAHSPVRDNIYKKLMTAKSNLPILVDYSTENFPEGMAAAF